MRTNNSSPRPLTAKIATKSLPNLLNYIASLKKLTSALNVIWTTTVPNSPANTNVYPSRKNPKFLVNAKNTKNKTWNFTVVSVLKLCV